MKYIGTKIVAALTALGKDDADGYSVKHEDGYTSWSPKAAFEEAYRDVEGPVQALTFGDALYMLKLGKKMARAGWNGKGMWLRLFVPFADKQFQITEHEADPKYGDSGTLMPWIGIKTTDNKFVPWLASQTDVLAQDWVAL